LPRQSLLVTKSNHYTAKWDNWKSTTRHRFNDDPRITPIMHITQTLTQLCPSPRRALYLSPVPVLENATTIPYLSPISGTYATFWHYILAEVTTNYAVNGQFRSAAFCSPRADAAKWRNVFKIKGVIPPVATPSRVTPHGDHPRPAAWPSQINDLPALRRYFAHDRKAKEYPRSSAVIRRTRVVTSRAPVQGNHSGWS
jgi:hypothetical protein